jgi:hypothetical protein
LRGNLAWLADDLHEQGHSFLEIANRLNLSPRTLRSWCADLKGGCAQAVPLGRPTVRSPRDERSAVLAILDELGPATGLPTLRACFPFMARAELEDLLRRYRCDWQRRHQHAPHILRWLTPGAVWAIDFSQPTQWIDGHDRYLLAVRDLASGQQLLWLPVFCADSDVVMAALRSLFAQHGAPLVLKTDNGSPFGAGATQDFLRQILVLCLFSPPRTPRYNGAIEAGIGSLKMRTENRATFLGHPGYWTTDDVAFAQAQANSDARPLGLNGPSPETLWQGRPGITTAQRDTFRAAVSHLRQEAIAREGTLPDCLSITRQRLIDRDAIGRALVEHGYLLFSRRRLPLPLSSAKAAEI